MNINSDSRKKNTYDAIVVGTGISGGWAAKELTEDSDCTPSILFVTVNVAMLAVFEIMCSPVKFPVRVVAPATVKLFETVRCLFAVMLSENVDSPATSRVVPTLAEPLLVKFPL